MKPTESDDDLAVPTASDDDLGGDTKAHYLPNKPRTPADGIRVEISIAEMFQETLWRAFAAGAAAGVPTREAFVHWYEREVLR